MTSSFLTSTRRSQVVAIPANLAASLIALLSCLVPLTPTAHPIIDITLVSALKETLIWLLLI